MQEGIDLRSRTRGYLLGLAADDILGTTLEFQRPGTFTPITDMVGGRPFRLEPGERADETSMALCPGKRPGAKRGGCRYIAGLIIGALQGRGKQEMLSPGFCPVQGPWEAEPLAAAIPEIGSGSFKGRQPPEIIGTGHVVRSLEAALWAFHRSIDFREGALVVINLRDDADTTGAVHGQLAGAHHSEEGILERWRVGWRCASRSRRRRMR